MHKSVVNLALLAFLCGISVASIWIRSNLVLWLSILLLVFNLLRIRNDLKSKEIIVVLMAFSVGVIRMWMSIPMITELDVSSYNDLPEQKVKLEAIVERYPDRRSDFQYLVLAVHELQVEDVRLGVNGLVKIKVDKFPEYQYQDRLLVEGFLLSPRDYENFYYSDLLAKEGIYSVMYYPRIKNLNTSISWVDFWWICGEVRLMVLSRINRLFSEPTASIVAGLLLGERRNIPQAMLDDFGITGLTHILAISGYNITLIINILTVLLIVLPRGWRSILIIVSIAVFMVLTGLSPSVIRASLMGMLVVFARAMERKADVITTLLMSCVLMTIYNPRLLNFDLSFQLSVAATISLIVVMPWFENLQLNVGSIVKENLYVTLAAQIFTIPIIVFHFQKLSLISPLANLIVLPFIPLIMFSGFATLLISIIPNYLTGMLVAVTFGLTMIMQYIVEFIANFPFAQIELAGVSIVVILMYYLAVMLIFHKSKSGRDSVSDCAQYIVPNPN